MMNLIDVISISNNSSLVLVFLTWTISFKTFLITKCLYVEHLKSSSPQMCSCFPSTFNYKPAGHAITDDVNIVNNDYLKSLIQNSDLSTDIIILGTL